MAMYPTWLMLFLFLSGGDGLSDAVSMFPARDYLKMHGIELTQGKLIELAQTDPKTPKAQVMQLQALRLLAEDAKLDPANLKVVRDIAEGKRAADRQGFSRAYARRVLAAAGEKADAPEARKAKVEQGLEWFPAEAKFVGVLDFRLGQPDGAAADPMLDMWKFMPEKARAQILKQVYAGLEQTGNVAVDRLALALVEGDKGLTNPRVYVRVSGKFNQDWLIAVFQKLAPIPSKTGKSAGDENYQYVEFNGFAFALVNDDEFIIAGDLARPDFGRGVELLEAMLEVKAGKKESALKSKRIRDLLKKVPDRAMGFLVADLPKDAKFHLPGLAEMALPPEKAFLTITPALKALDVQFELVMQNQQDARDLVKGLFQLRETQIQQLKAAEGKAGVPGLTTRPLVQVLESFQVQAKDRSVHMRYLHSHQTVREVIEMFMRMIPPDLDGPAPPPAPGDGKGA